MHAHNYLALQGPAVTLTSNVSSDDQPQLIQWYHRSIFEMFQYLWRLIKQNRRQMAAMERQLQVFDLQLRSPLPIQETHGTGSGQQNETSF